jgi:hypothetical protein
MTQILNKDFNPNLHEKFKALTVKQPWADRILVGAKSIEVRSKRTGHRGDLLITASASPKGQRTGMTICTVELYDVKPISELSRAEMFDTGIAEHKWNDYKGYGWFLRNPIPVTNVMVRGQLGIFNLSINKGQIRPILFEEDRPPMGIAIAWTILAVVLAGLVGVGFLIKWLFR